MRHGLKAGVGLILILAAAAAAWSQDKLVLTLEDCIRLALEQNPIYLAEKTKEDGASSMVRQAMAGFFPASTPRPRTFSIKNSFPSNCRRSFPACRRRRSSSISPGRISCP